ncbi:MAG: hypothetical protein ACRDHU_13025 [Actinomycetota bacterium]
MSLETAFKELAQAFDVVRNAIVGLRLTVVEDQPDQGSVALVDWFADFVEDVWGTIQMGVNAVEQGHRAAQVPQDLDTAHRALMGCQRARDLVGHRLSAEPGVLSRLEELRSFGRERDGEWRAWTDETFAALERCRRSLEGVVDPLFVSWQDLAEMLASPLISVRTTSIGQQFTLPHEEGIRT